MMIRETLAFLEVLENIVFLESIELLAFLQVQHGDGRADVFEGVGPAERFMHLAKARVGCGGVCLEVGRDVREVFGSDELLGLHFACGQELKQMAVDGACGQ